MENYAWHKVSEEEKQEIKNSSKKLLAEFSSKLSKIKTPEPKPEKKENSRKEKNGWQTENEFRELMMENAPFVDDGLIVAEKGGWKNFRS